MTGKPRVSQHLFRGEPVPWVSAQQRADEAARPGAQGLWHSEVTPADLGKECARVAVVERVPPHQQGVQKHSEAPAVSSAATVTSARGRRQDLGAHVRGAAMLIAQRIVQRIVQDHRVFESFKLEPRAVMENEYMLPPGIHSFCALAPSTCTLAALMAHLEVLLE